MSTYGLAILIESLGDRSITGPSPSDGEYRYAWCTERAANQDTRLSFPVLRGLPSEISVTTDFIGAKSTIGGQNFALDGSNAAVGPRFWKYRTDKISNLSAGLTTAGSTTATLKNDDGTADTAQAGKTILIGREAIYLVSHSGGGVYVCERGVLSTTAEIHPVTATDDTHVFDCDQGPLLQDMTVDLVRYSLEDWTDRKLLWQGVVRDIDSPAGGMLTVQVDSGISLLQKRKIWNTPATFRPILTEPIHDRSMVGTPKKYVWTDGTSTVPPVYEGPDSLLSIDGTAAGNTDVYSSTGGLYKARTPRILPESAPADYSVETKVWEYLSTSPAAPPLNAAGDRFGQMASGSTSSAITAIFQVLTTTISGKNGNFDLGDPDRPHVGRNIGVGIPTSLIDMAGIAIMEDLLGGDARQDGLSLGFDGPGVSVYEWIQDVLRPYGATLTVGADSKISIIRLLDWATASTPSINVGDFVGDIAQNRALSGTIDALEVEYNDRPGKGTLSVTYKDALHSARLFNSSKSSRSFVAPGITSLSRITLLASAYLQRFRASIPMLRCKLLRDKDFWPGQILKVTHPFIFDHDGTRGVTDAVYLVSARRSALGESAIWYELMRMDLGRQALIAPSGRISSYANGGGSGPFVLTMLTATDYGHEQFVLGDDIRLLNSDFTVDQAGPFTIVDVTANTLTVDIDIPGGASSGQWVTLRDYDEALASSVGRHNWAWIADANSNLGAANDDAFTWVQI